MFSKPTRLLIASERWDAHVEVRQLDSVLVHLLCAAMHSHCRSLSVSNIARHILYNIEKQQRDETAS